MKKFLAILLCVFLLATCFVACNKEEEPAETDVPSETTKTPETTKAPDNSNNNNNNDNNNDNNNNDNAGDNAGDIGDGDGEKDPTILMDWGEGTAEDPYILTQANFADYYENFNYDYYNAYVKMGEDIVVNQGSNADWAAGNNLPAEVTEENPAFGLWRGPMGGTEIALTGGFDGDGHTISGVCFIGLDENAGEPTNRHRRVALFAGMGNGAYIKNLKLVNSYFKADSNAGYSELGGLVGRFGLANTPDANNLIDNCYVDAIFVSDRGNTNMTGAGGIAGATYGAGTISNCVVKGQIVSIDVTGGIVGNAKEDGAVIVKNCANYADITTPSDFKSTGGVVGHLGAEGGITLTIENCVNAGDIIGNGTTAGRQPGGILGHTNSDGVIIKNCLNVGNVSNSDATLKAAGIVGNQNGKTITIERCINLGNADDGDILTAAKPDTVTLVDYIFVPGYSDNMLDPENAKTAVEGTWDIITLTVANLSEAATFAQGGALAGWVAGTATNVPTPIAVPTAITWASITANA